MQSKPVTIIRMSGLTCRLKLSKSTIHDRLDPKSPRHDKNFPRQISLGGGHAVGWIESEVDAYLAGLIEKSRGAAQ